MKILWQDLRYAFRSLSRKPVFTVGVILTLALGIGVNAAFLTLFGVALAPLPVKDADAMVSVGSIGSHGTFYSFPDYAYMRDHAQTFSGVTADTWLYQLTLARSFDSQEPQSIFRQF